MNPSIMDIEIVSNPEHTSLTDELNEALVDLIIKGVKGFFKNEIEEPMKLVTRRLEGISVVPKNIHHWEVLVSSLVCELKKQDKKKGKELALLLKGVKTIEIREKYGRK
jgi:hypothetical protein